MPDERTKYQLHIAMHNGQAFQCVTYMEERSIAEEIDNAKADQRRARFDAFDPFREPVEKIVLQVWPDKIDGFMVTHWHRPMPQPQGRPALIQ